MADKILLVKMPEEWDGTCKTCPQNECLGIAERCPFIFAKPVVEVHGWSEICNADKLYTVKEG